MKHLRHAPIAVALLTVAALAWVLIVRASDRARWLQVEVPAQIVSGGKARITLTLEPPIPTELIGVDLHWKNARREYRGTLSTSRAQPLRSDQSAYHFDLSVPARPTMAYVHAVIYVSPNGRWRDRTRACLSELMTVSGLADPAEAGRRRQITAHDQPLAPPPPRQDSRLLCWTGALFWALAGLACWQVCRRGRRAAPGVVLWGDRRWVWLAVACLLAAVWEASAAEAGLGDLLRRYALAHGWYEDRRHLQEILTAVVIAVSLVVAIAAVRRDHAQPVSLVFTSADAYWGVSAISFISLHDADAWLATPVLTIPIVQVVRLAAALVALGGAARAAWTQLHHRTPTCPFESTSPSKDAQPD